MLSAAALSRAGHGASCAANAASWFTISAGSSRGGTNRRRAGNATATASQVKKTPMAQCASGDSTGWAAACDSRPLRSQPISGAVDMSTTHPSRCGSTTMSPTHSPTHSSAHAAVCAAEAISDQVERTKRRSGATTAARSGATVAAAAGTTPSSRRGGAAAAPASGTAARSGADNSWATARAAPSPIGAASTTPAAAAARAGAVAAVAAAAGAAPSASAAPSAALPTRTRTGATAGVAAVAVAVTSRSGVPLRISVAAADTTATMSAAVSSDTTTETVAQASSAAPSASVVAATMVSDTTSSTLLVVVVVAAVMVVLLLLPSLARLPESLPPVLSRAAAASVASTDAPGARRLPSGAAVASNIGTRTCACASTASPAADVPASIVGATCAAVSAEVDDANAATPAAARDLTPSMSSCHIHCTVSASSCASDVTRLMLPSLSLAAAIASFSAAGMRRRAATAGSSSAPIATASTSRMSARRHT
mmetsp:Transcript_3600/g.13122  ORF Transcript_3600/g.13122 Transcript_3600/m.13122 type:complete len:482 (-) Transcript_3600:1722-3167(-)